MAKTVKMRPWTATDVYKLKGLAKRKVGVTKIARALKRTAGATAVKAHQLGVSLARLIRQRAPERLASVV
jgi:hypothetical protein